ncbi:hypothetical protein PanWU01x14_341530 [Parasponia andersonii]|uniref:Uncharacterized protein n=1 Tax=Parasponia andersonii TaxID=3476 RepID=A0A2P5AE65_PARAD|nr:hypothetical protein PanWU01x14_341530 [Parasponia andersonii]
MAYALERVGRLGQKCPLHDGDAHHRGLRAHPAIDRIGIECKLVDRGYMIHWRQLHRGPSPPGSFDINRHTLHPRTKMLERSCVSTVSLASSGSSMPRRR